MFTRSTAARNFLRVAFTEPSAQGASQMELLTWAVIVLETVLNTTVFHFQRYTLNIARELVATDAADHDTRDIANIQVLITPTVIGTLGWLNYLLIAVACALAFVSWGWFAVIAIMVWALAGTAVVNVVWPFPTERQSAALVRREISRGMSRLALAGAAASPAFELYTRLLMKSVHTPAALSTDS